MTTHSLRLLPTLAALAFVLPACANRGATADASAETPGQEGSVATYASTSKDGSKGAYGMLTVHDRLTGDSGNEGASDETSEPQQIGYMVDLMVLDGCDPDRTLYFAYDSDQVGDSAEMKIDDVADCLQQPPLRDEHIDIIGHADERGSDSYNRELGLDRANSVAQVLASAGVDRSRIETYSRGEYMADDPSYWDDRRVVIRLAK